MAAAPKIEAGSSGVLVDGAHRIENCVELAQWRAQMNGKKTAYIFLPSGEGEESSLTYEALDRRARAVAVWLQKNCRPGARVLLMLPSGLEYISAFFGCLYGGMIAVPAFPPSLNNGRHSQDRLVGIIADAAVSVVLTTTAILPRVRRFVSDSGAAIAVSALGEIEDSLSEEWRDPSLASHDIALLQYTSGSTSAPKGVMISHANILHNELMIQQACAHTAESTFVGWLPLYHDMGLMGNILQPLYLGSQSVLLSPLTFLQMPVRWLQAISRYRGHTSGGPNFAYELCVRKILPEERSGLDLSSWKVAFNGAERVHAETLERFAAAFASCGFQYRTFFPCYGLAETTLMVSGSKTGIGPTVRLVGARELEIGKAEDAKPDCEAISTVSCGKPVVLTDVLIVDRATGKTCEDGETGEVWVSGPAVSAGYWNKPRETEETFRAKLSQDDDRYFCRTQDMGFLYKGELFITGRYRDLIIIRVQNYHPEDIEWTVQECELPAKKGLTAVFSIPINNEEKVVVLQEVEGLEGRDGEALAAHIRSAISQHHEIAVHAVAFVKMGSLPKTTSGKIQRHLCRKEFIAGTRKTLWTSIPRETDSDAGHNTAFIRKDLAAKGRGDAVSYLCSFLRRSLAQCLKLPDVDAGQRMAGLGIDSLAAVELKNLSEKNFGVRIPLARLFSDISVTQLAEDIWQQIASETENGGEARSESLRESTISYGQRSLWLAHQASPGSSVHRIARAMQIKGNIPVKKLQDAFSSVVERHSALRTTYFSIGAEVFQQAQGTGFQFEVSESADWPDEELTARIAEEANRPFDLKSGPVLRVHLFQRGASKDILLIVVHHIAADLWSFGLIVEQLGQLLAAPQEPEEEQNEACRLTSDYAEFAEWQTNFLRSSEADSQLAYWQQYLSGDLSPIDLLACGGKGEAAEGANAQVHFTIDQRLTWDLRELCRKYNLSLYALFLAAFQALLHRYSGAEEIIISSPSHGRSLAKFAATAGYFVNPILRRGYFPRDLTFAQLLQATGKDIVNSLDRQDYPFGMLVENMPKIRDLFGRSRLASRVNFTFQSVLPHHNADLLSFALGIQNSVIRLGPVDLELLPLENVESESSLSLMMAEIENKVVGLFQYSTREFICDQIEQMKAHFLNLLHELAKSPDKPLDAVTYLSRAERKQVLEEWNQTEAAYPGDRCVHELFAEQVMRTPEAVAVVYEEQQLSYGELNRRANQLGHSLRKLGVGPEVRVGLCVKRSLEMVIGVLGILKAGGTYVPMDPDYPAERLRYMQEDAEVSVILMQEHLRRHFPISAALAVCIDTEWEQISKESEEDPKSNAGSGSESLAYVMYTSGSTGNPKGIMISHRAIHRLVFNASYLEMQVSDRTAQAANFSFDAATFEVWGTLLCGGCLVILSNDVLLAPQLLRQELLDQKITVMFLTTALFNQAIEAAGSIFQPLRCVLFGGELVNVESVRAVLRSGSPERLLHVYGPTEVTTFSSWHWIREIEEGASNIPIGKPIGNTQAYVLDGEMNPAGKRIAGELYLGGAGLGRGYWRRAGLTAEKFVPNPYSGRGGERLYRTGDRARWLESGELEFLGRVDNQVKLRGYRIELGEIETVMQQHQAVRQAVVLLRGEHEEKRLMGYVVLQDRAEGNGQELRRYLQQKLPEYMIPSAILELAEMPLTGNGKIDRKALMQMEAGEAERECSYVGPRNKTEEILVSKWEDILKQKKIGIHDNFFSLGGDSLRAIKLCSDLQIALAHEKPLLPILFSNPTIAGISEQLQQNDQISQHS